eukprot:459672_1
MSPIPRSVSKIALNFKVSQVNHLRALSKINPLSPGQLRALHDPEVRLAHLENNDTSKKIKRYLEESGSGRWDVRYTESLSKEDVRWADLVVSVGGDGTFLSSTHSISNEDARNTTILSVNSSVSTSVGFLSAADAESFPSVLDGFLSGSIETRKLWRMQIVINGQVLQTLVSNDVLFSARDPSSTAHYEIEYDGCHQIQKSSGIWVSTSAGSTGAIFSSDLCFLSLERMSDDGVQFCSVYPVMLTPTVYFVNPRQNGEIVSILFEDVSVESFLREADAALGKIGKNPLQPSRPLDRSSEVRAKMESLREQARILRARRQQKEIEVETKVPPTSESDSRSSQDSGDHHSDSGDHPEPASATESQGSGLRMSADSPEPGLKSPRYSTSSSVSPRARYERMKSRAREARARRKDEQEAAALANDFEAREAIKEQAEMKREHDVRQIERLLAERRCDVKRTREAKRQVKERIEAARRDRQSRSNSMRKTDSDAVVINSKKSTGDSECIVDSKSGSPAPSPLLTSHTSCRLAIRLRSDQSAVLRCSFPPRTPLVKVCAHIEREHPAEALQPYVLRRAFPVQRFGMEARDVSVEDLGLCPDARLVIESCDPPERLAGPGTIPSESWWWSPVGLFSSGVGMAVSAVQYLTGSGQPTVPSRESATGEPSCGTEDSAINHAATVVDSTSGYTMPPIRPARPSGVHRLDFESENKKKKKKNTYDNGNSTMFGGD